MKITEVELFQVDVPDRHWAWSDDVFGMPGHRRDQFVVVRICTDAGVDGLGEVNLRFPRALVDEGVAEWVGLDPLTINLAAAAAAPDTSAASRPLRAAFECAVLDIRGKVLGCPVSELLGGAVRDRVPVSLCTGYKTVENTAEDAAWGWEQGFRTYKMKCIVPDQTPSLYDRITYIVDRVCAIHERVPDMAVRPDIRRRLQEVWAAEEVARQLEGHRLDCLEDPIESGARAGTFSEWRRLRQRIAFPVAEHTPPGQALAMWQADAIDYCIIGSPSRIDTVRTASTLSLLGLEAWTQSVGLGIENVLTFHICAAGPAMSRPHDIVGLWAKEDTCLEQTFPVVDGHVATPTEPGLGITLNMAAIERYAVNGQH